MAEDSPLPDPNSSTDPPAVIKRLGKEENSVESEDSAEKTDFETILEQHFLLIVIGSVIGGILLLGLIISAVFSLKVMMKKKRKLQEIIKKDLS